MAITTPEQLFDALLNNASRLVIDKASLANAAAGQLFSLWRATGQPGQGAIPGTTPQLCDNTFAGCFSFTQQTAPAESCLGWIGGLAASNSAMGWEVHDRIAHVGGLVLNLTTSQPIIGGAGIDLDSLSIPADRRGEANYSDGQWFLEVYADGGATASNATINVTYSDGTSANLTAVAVGGTLRIGRLIALTPLIPVADQGKFIRRVNSVILSASTGTAGNFGVPWRRQRTARPTPVANLPNTFDWAALGAPKIPNGSCLQLTAFCSTTSTGTLRGQGKIGHG